MRIKISTYCKVWFSWEGLKICKNLRRTFDKSVVFCARNSVLVKKSTKIFQNKCGQVVFYQLYPHLMIFWANLNKFHTLCFVSQLGWAQTKVHFRSATQWATTQALEAWSVLYPLLLKVELLSTYLSGCSAQELHHNEKVQCHEWFFEQI